MVCRKVDISVVIPLITLYRRESTYLIERIDYRNLWLSFLGHQDDDKEMVKERPNSEGTISSLRNTGGTKEDEREDLVTRFDRVVRGDPDEAFQV